MIKANELRVGNWVSVKSGFGKVRTIEGEGEDETYAGVISNDNESVWERISTTYSEPAEPIILTSEILSKLSFEKWNNSNIFSIDFKGGQSIQVRPERKEVVLFGSDAATDGHGFVIDNIEFLHQLQNIFGAIGKELEIKLQPDALI